MREPKGGGLGPYLCVRVATCALMRQANQPNHTNTMIAQEVTRNEWIDAFARGDDADFSYEAADALYDYYWDLSDDICETLYLDRVAVRCEWSEYTEDEVREQYKVDYDEDVEVALVDRGLVSYAIKVPMHGRPHHYLVMD